MEPQEQQNPHIAPNQSAECTDATIADDHSYQVKSFKPFVLFFCILALIVSTSITFARPSSKAAAFDDPPTSTPTSTRTPTLTRTPTITLTPTITPTPTIFPLFTPPRGVGGDLWADKVLGKPNFESFVPNTVVNHKLFTSNGAIYYPDPDDPKLLVYDSGNSRILGIDINRCLSSPNEGCEASFVIGQPDFKSSGSNSDSGWQQFPYRRPASADSLSGLPEHQLSTDESGSGASMAVDKWGRLYVTDYFNHRVLMYPPLFSTGTPTFTRTPSPTPNVTDTPASLTNSPTNTLTPTITPTSIKAIAVWGQPDFSANACNRILPFSANQINNLGQAVPPLVVLPSPTTVGSLCFNYGGSNNFVAGLDVAPDGSLWVVDSGNNRVLHYPNLTPTTVPGMPVSTPDIVLGQLDLIHGDRGSDSIHLSDPSVVRVDPQTGKVYVADTGNQRVMVYGPIFYPVVAGTPTPNVGTIFKIIPTRTIGPDYLNRPMGLDFDPSWSQLWVATNETNKISLWPVDRATPTPTATSSGPTLTPTETPLGGTNQSTDTPSPTSSPTSSPTPTASGTPLIVLGITGPSGSIAIQPTADAYGSFERIFATSGYVRRGADLSHRNDVGMFSVPVPPNSPPQATLTPIKWLFGSAPNGNAVTISGLANGSGVVVTNNPTPQLITNDNEKGGRLLYWNNPTNAQGDVTITNGQAATGEIVLPGSIYATEGTIKATTNYLYVSEGGLFETPFIFVYRLPLNNNSTPVTTFTWPFATVDGDDLAHFGDYDSVMWGLAPTDDDHYLWVSTAGDSRVFRVVNPVPPTITLTPTGAPPTSTATRTPTNTLTPTTTHTPSLCGGPCTNTPTPTKTPPPDPPTLTPLKVDIVLGQRTPSGISCNYGGTEGTDATADSLCWPGALSIDRKGNLWVSDHSLEGRGNFRLLEFDQELFATPTGTPHTLFALPASRIFPNLGTWETAFDRQNRMVVGYNPYGGEDRPLPPASIVTPLPGVSIADPSFVANYKGYFMGVYNHPLFPLSTPVPRSSPSPTPTIPVHPPIPDSMIKDFQSMAIGATFDDFDNLYVRDLDRHRVLVYKQPGYGTPVVWATPLVNVTITPTGNNLEKDDGTDGEWDAGAVSVQAIASGNGHAQITVNDQDDKSRAFGLTRASAYHGHHLEDIDYAYALLDDGTLAIYEGGEQVTLTATPTYGEKDILRIAIESQSPGSDTKVVRYYQDGDAVYTSTRTIHLTDYPLVFDTSIADSGGQISNAFISGDTVVDCASSGWCRDHNTRNSSTGSNVLNGVTVIPPSDADDPIKIWAVGGYNVTENGGTQSGGSLIEHWDGTIWNNINVDSLGAGILRGITAYNDSGTWKLWVVGDNKILKYNGSIWTKVHDTGGNAVSADTATDVWTVGTKPQGIKHSTDGGSTWITTTISSSTTKLYGVTALASNNVWMVGSSGANGYIMHWTGSWSAEYAPVPAGSSSPVLKSIAAYDANHIWVVGSYYDNQGHQQTLTDFWDGTGWNNISSSGVNVGNNNHLQSAWFTKQGDVWASGSYTPTGTLNSQSLLVRWNDRSWEQVNVHSQGVGSQFSAISAELGSSDVLTGTWAVGSYTPRNGAPSQTLLEQLQAPTAPITATTAYYETSADSDTHYTQGCTAAHRRESGVIMLNYGQPVHWTTDTPTTDHYGTVLYDGGGTAETECVGQVCNQDGYILTAAEFFAAGYHDCLEDGDLPVHITIVPTTNNNVQSEQAALTAEHADAWAHMVEDLSAYILANGWTDEMDAAGGISLHPSWSAHAPALNWVYEYSTHNLPTAYNFGTTDGYPTGAPNPVPTSPWTASAWPVDRLYWASDPSVFFMQAFPLITNSRSAREWYRVKRWSLETGNHMILQFPGAAGANAEQAWQTLHLQLNADPDTRIKEKVEQSMTLKCSNGGDINDNCQ